MTPFHSLNQNDHKFQENKHLKKIDQLVLSGFPNK